MKHPRVSLAIGAALLGSVAIGAPSSADHGPSLDPASVEAVIFPGQSYEVEKTVHTPEIPPDPEIYFLVDTTGSMGPVIAQVQADINAIIADISAAQPTATFGLGQYRDFPFDSFAYDHMVSIGGDVPAAVGGLVAGGGADGSEGQFFALDQIAKNNTAGFSGGDGSTPIIVWIGDAPAHDPVCTAISGLPYDITEASVTGDLVAADYTVVTLSTTTSAAFYPNGLDDNPILSAGNYAPGCVLGGAAGQATRIAGATGGAALANVDPADVAQAVLDALSAVEVSVSMTSNCAATTGGVIDTTFDPASRDVESGDTATFTETISVAADAPGGTYVCQDWALIDGEPMRDAAGEIVYETKTILVPENFVTGGGHVTNGEKGKNRATVLNFGGNAGYMADGSVVGHWNFQIPGVDVQLSTTEITAIQFFDTGLDPAPPEADADSALVEAIGDVKLGKDSPFGDGTTTWLRDCTMTFAFQDGGEPEEDSVGVLAVTCGGTVLGPLVEVTGGNIQIHEGTKG